MTRFTNFARKRTYVQAGFDSEPQTQLDDANLQPTSTSGETGLEPEAKKRKRVRSRKPKFSDTNVTVAGVNQDKGDGAGEGEGGAGEVPSERPSKKGKFGDKGKRGNQVGQRYPKGEFSPFC